MTVVIGKERIACDDLDEAFSLVAYEFRERRWGRVQRSPVLFAIIETILLSLIGR